MTHSFQLTQSELETALPKALELAKHAGGVAMDFRRSGAFQVYTKSDQSKVTDADYKLHDIITAELPKILPGITVLSEEDKQHPVIDIAQPFWAVDPIDNTRGFIDGDRFYVNIALIDKGLPVLGIIEAPYRNTVASALWHKTPELNDRAQGIIKALNGKTAPVSGDLSVLGFKRYGLSLAFQNAAAKLKARGLEVNTSQANTVLSNDLPAWVQIADGRADIYVNSGTAPSLQQGNGYSWDYAPNWLILRGSGGALIEIQSGQEVRFTDPTERMNAMIAVADRNNAKRYFKNYEISC